jgi:hypothetical protein
MRILGGLSSHLSAGVTAICATQGLCAQSACQVQLLIASDTTQGDILGASVVISNDAVGVGAWRDDDNGYDSGAAYVFRFDEGTDTWIEAQKLLASDGAAYDYFGAEIALDHDLAVVSAPYDDAEDCGNPPFCDQGSVYVFRFEGGKAKWVQIQKLLPTDSEPEELFGLGLALSGSVLVVGASLDSENGSEAGAAYVFRFDGTLFVQEQKLLPLDGAAGDRFGFGVATDGNRAVIGARRHDHSGTDAGSAYVFEYNGHQWIQQQELHASDAAPADRFGRSIAVDRSVIVIGARDDDVVGINSGSAYVFRHNGAQWQEEQKLVPSDGAAHDWFGECVAVSGGGR